MKTFNTKYRYILPILCLASFSAQATHSEEQEKLNQGKIKSYEGEGVSHEGKVSSESEKYNLSDIPAEIFHHISSYLPRKENDALRLTSKFTKQTVYEAYKSNLKAHFINESMVRGDVLTDVPEIALAPSKSHYTHRLMQEACEDYLEKTGFLAVVQGSLLEGYLNRNYKSVPLYAYLKDQPASAKKLFKILFDRELPEEKYELALNLLCGCLPSNHIYVKKDIQDASPLLEKFNTTLLKSIKGNQRKYFIWGIDEDFNVLEKGDHVIVVNQSTQENLPNNQESLRKLENYSYNTVIFNADQEALELPGYLLKKMQKLILVNGNNQCISIEKAFLTMHPNLQSFSAKGLNSVHQIKDYFLYRCHELSTFNSEGLSNLGQIGSNFLLDNKRLSTFISQGFTNLETIGNGFLYCCLNLSNFNSNGFANLKQIGNYFLGDCDSLSTFLSQGFTNLETIGNRFLAGTQFDGDKIREELLKKKK